MISRLLGGIEPMPVKNDIYFRHLKAGEKDNKRSDKCVAEDREARAARNSHSRAWYYWCRIPFRHCNGSR